MSPKTRSSCVQKKIPSIFQAVGPGPVLALMKTNQATPSVPTKAPSALEPRMLYDRKTAALKLSISVRSLDYLIAGKQLATRRIGKKVLVPHGELVRYSRADHFEPVSA